jgi:predicted dehydrogenase
MSKAKHRVAIIGCGRLGQGYVNAYSAFPETEIVAIAEYNDERRAAVGERFGVSALYKDVSALLKDAAPDIAAIVTPTKFYKDAVIACAEAGVKGVSTDKPIAATLSDADEMVESCRSRGVVYSGGNLQRAMPEVQDAAARIESGEFGELIGAAVHRFGGEISGGGCQHIAVLTQLANARVEEVIAWASPPEALEGEDDGGLIIHGRFRLASGLECSVFGSETPLRGISLWTEDSLIEWDWAPPAIYQGFNNSGNRVKIDPNYGYEPYESRDGSDKYLNNSIRTFLSAVEGGGKLAVSGDDLRHALEVAIACKVSALSGNKPIKLPLDDRSLTLRPVQYRWLGGDVSGRPQSLEEAAGKKKPAK